MTIQPCIRRRDECEELQAALLLPKAIKQAECCGLKKTKLDLAVIASEVPAAAAGVFTTNLVQAAPVKVTREHLARSGTAKAVVINSANANACTGPQGS